MQRILDVRSVYKGWVELVIAQVRTSSGEIVDREIVLHRGAVGVLAYDPDRKVALLVRQPRTPVLRASGEESVLEVIAGLLDEDDPEACARREAMEEAGLKLGAVEFVARVWSTPGMSTERIGLYLATYAAHDRVAPGGGVEGEHEEIEVVELPLSELARMADAGEIVDLKTLALVMALRVRRADLF